MLRTGLRTKSVLDLFVKVQSNLNLKTFKPPKDLHYLSPAKDFWIDFHLQKVFNFGKKFDIESDLYTEHELIGSIGLTIQKIMVVLPVSSVLRYALLVVYIHINVLFKVLKVSISTEKQN